MLQLVTGPAAAPVLLAEVKTRLGVSDSSLDGVLPGLISAATALIDGPSGVIARALITQTWDLVLDGWPQPVQSLYGADLAPIRIPLPPLQQIVSVSYVDVNGVQQTVASSAYKLIQGRPATIAPVFGTVWPVARAEGGAVTIRFIAGYGADGSFVPEPIRTAIVLQVAHLKALSERNLFLQRDLVAGVGEKQYAVTSNAGDALDAAVKSMLQPYRCY